VTIAPRNAEEAVKTAAEGEALEAVRRASGEVDGAMERHGLRVFLIACELAERRGLEVDREVLLVSGLLHDLGLYDEISTSGVYVTEGAEFATALVSRHGWDEPRMRLLHDAIERHHEVRSQRSAGEEVELIRRADLVDVSNGLVAAGLPRAWLRELFATVSRDGTYREIGRMVGHALRHRPLTMPRIFLRGH
jgi:HD domain-containing protein